MCQIGAINSFQSDLHISQIDDGGIGILCELQFSKAHALYLKFNSVLPRGEVGDQVTLTIVQEGEGVAPPPAFQGVITRPTVNPVIVIVSLDGAFASAATKSVVAIPSHGSHPFLITAKVAPDPLCGQQIGEIQWIGFVISD